MSPDHKARLAAFPLALACLAMAPGCPRTPPTPTGHFRPGAGSSPDAVLHETPSVSSTEDGTLYAGDGWALPIDASAGWSATPDDGCSLHLVRPEGDADVHLRLSAYAVRDGMGPNAFFAANAMWRNEEGASRIEPVWDDELGAGRGYSLDDHKEAYYAFWVAGDRGYVLEASASAGVLKKAAVSEFHTIAKQFRCEPRSGSEEERAPH